MTAPREVTCCNIDHMFSTSPRNMISRVAEQLWNLLRSCYVRRFGEKMSSKRVAPLRKWTPSEARYEFRTNPELEGSSTSGYCMGYLQANLAILPSSLADEFEQFCELNKAPCPLLYRSKRGELSAGILARKSDVRYENQNYNVPRENTRSLPPAPQPLHSL